MRINYDPAYKCCAQVIATHDILYPLDVRALIKSYDIKMIGYTQLANKANIPISEVLEAMPEYGLLEELHGVKKILYNDTLSEGTIRFTLLHELGHHLMGHKSGDGLSDQEITTNENLANCFARNLIAPASLCFYLNLTDRHSIRNYFNVSISAARVREDFLYRDKVNIHNLSLHAMFSYSPAY